MQAVRCFQAASLSRQALLTLLAALLVRELPLPGPGEQTRRNAAAFDGTNHTRAPPLEAQAKARTMAERPKRPLRRRVQARVMRMVNVPMRVVLGLPVATPLGGRLMLVTIIGRKTGKVYRQPLSYVRQGTTLLTPGGGKWKLNLRDDQPVPIRLRGHDILARPELVKDLDEIERLLTVMAAANRSVNAFVGIPKGPDGRLDRTRLQTAVRYGFRIVRWHLDEPPVSPNSPGQRSETR
jgi:F420H(2)-dependent quinone reductase